MYILLYILFIVFSNKLVLKSNKDSTKISHAHKCCSKLVSKIKSEENLLLRDRGK